MTESNPEQWCMSTEEHPDESYQEEIVEVQEDYIPDRWNG